MGLRIHKTIGYYFPHKSLQKIAVKNYREVINQILEHEDAYFKMKESIFKELSEGSGLESILAQMSIKEYEEKFAQPSGYTPFEEVYFGDTYKGLLIHTIDHARCKRSDDLIDFYENNATPTNRIKRLLHNIYPTYGYVYLGGLEQRIEDKLELNQKERIEFRDIQMTNIVMNDTIKTADNLVKNGFFAPKMEEEAFCILKSMQIFNKELEEKDFYKNSYPAIITYWS